jgi:hypothetical protein
MANFDVTCPIKYPVKCQLTEMEKEELMRSPGKNNVFFMYSSSDIVKEHIGIIKSHLISPNFNLLDWSEDKYTA